MYLGITPRVSRNFKQQKNLKQNQNFGCTHSAFVIEGGTAKTRECIVNNFYTILNPIKMFFERFHSDDGQKIGVLICNSPEDFEHKNFDDIAKLAGSKILGKNLGEKELKNAIGTSGIIDAEA